MLALLMCLQNIEDAFVLVWKKLSCLGYANVKTANYITKSYIITRKHCMYTELLLIWYLMIIWWKWCQYKQAHSTALVVGLFECDETDLWIWSKFCLQKHNILHFSGANPNTPQHQRSAGDLHEGKSQIQGQRERHCLEVSTRGKELYYLHILVQF